jgi:hypothetical protein
MTQLQPLYPREIIYVYTSQRIFDQDIRCRDYGEFSPDDVLIYHRN